MTSVNPDRYLYQIGTVPLLTREGEVAIAKRIERGERQILRALLHSPIAADGESRADRGARWRESFDSRRAAIGKVKALADELERADAELRRCRRRPGAPAAELGRVRRRARRSIAALERIGRSSAAAQRELWRELSEGIRIAEQARTEMVRANLRLVVSMARRYANRGVGFFDLIQEGNIGLMKGIEKFDHRLGYKVCTYVTWWIRVAMSRAVTEQTRTIRVPLNVHGWMSRVARTSRDLERTLGREATREEIAGRLALSAAKVQRILTVVKEPLSLETPVGPEGDGKLEDFIEDRHAASPADVLLSDELVERTRSALSVLTPREAKILRLRFGFDGPDAQTLEQISHVFGLTRERIRQIEAGAFLKLRRRRAVELRPLLEA